MIAIQEKSSVLFIIKLAKYVSIFGLTPWYNFKKDLLTSPKIFRCYSSILAVLLMYSCLRLSYLQYSVLFKTVSVHMICNFLFQLFSLATVLLTILGTSYWNMYNWANLYKYIKFVTQIKNKTFILRHGKTIFFLQNIYLFFLFFFNLKFLEDVGSYGCYFVITYLLVYYLFLITFLIVTLASLIKCKYHCINELFRTCNPENKDMVKTIRRIRRSYLKADDLVQYFNTLFGWPLLFVFFDVGSLMLSALVSTTMEHITWQDHIYHLNSTALIVNIFYVFQSGVSITNIAMCNRELNNNFFIYFHLVRWIL